MMPTHLQHICVLTQCMGVLEWRKEVVKGETLRRYHEDGRTQHPSCRCDNWWVSLLGQDLSIAGLRKGLEGERSGLFMEQIRIVKEMREHDRSGTDNYFRLYPRPRYLIWENVVGALTSPGKANKGKDFQAVLTEIVRIVCPNAHDVPMPEKGAWSKSGCIYGVGDDGVSFSLAWRVHDAQYWGVPQRRRRLCVLCDFSGTSAAEILLDPQYERTSPDGYPDEAFRHTGTGDRRKIQSLSKSMRGDTQTSGEEGQEITGAAPHRTGGAIAFEERAGCEGGGKGILISDERTGALRAGEAVKKVFRYQGESPDAVCLEYYPQDSRIKVKDDGICQTLTKRGGTGGNNVPLCMVTKPQTYAMQGFGDYIPSSSSSSLKQRDYKDATDLVVTCGTSIVRRITPCEEERLQGFPDGWTDIGAWVETSGKKHKDSSDSARYRALGNSIALPFWAWLARRICAQYERQITMGSLFDGIGGFPLVFQRAGAIPVWASEIEEFCIAVTKRHFGEE